MDYKLANKQEFEQIIEDVGEYYGAQWLNEIDEKGESHIDILVK